jgi:hypothetical protein
MVSSCQNRENLLGARDSVVVVFGAARFSGVGAVTRAYVMGQCAYVLNVREILHDFSKDGHPEKKSGTTGSACEESCNARRIWNLAFLNT